MRGTVRLQKTDKTVQDMLEISSVRQDMGHHPHPPQPPAVKKHRGQVFDQSQLAFLDLPFKTSGYVFSTAYA
jgi:hypothetical protein